ncbi:MAG: IS5 family transposase [Trueperaceae bacterium]
MSNTKAGSWERLQRLRPEEFKRLVGVKPKTFEEMVDIVRPLTDKTGKRGRGFKLSAEDMVLLTLEYLRDYPTYLRLGHDWGIHESRICRISNRVEEILLHSGTFKLPGKKKLKSDSDTVFEVVLIDGAESPVERPKKKQRSYSSGKKKRHTLTSQLMLDKASKQIVCTFLGKGREHDFKLFKRSGYTFKETLELKADKGYQGLKHLHANSQTPYRKPPKQTLSKEQRATNRKLASEHIRIEHVIGNLTVFRILQERYRNRRKHFGLRLNLIAGIYNYELAAL